LVGKGFNEVSNKVVLLSGLDDHIVDLGFNIALELRLHALLDRLLVRGTSVFQTEGHDLIAVDAITHNEHYLVLIIRI
jgi:hypothetical protein